MTLSIIRNRYICILIQVLFEVKTVIKVTRNLKVISLCVFHYNPTRPSHLVGGALVRCRRAYSPSEIRSIRAVGLEQSPAYFSRRVRSMSRTPDREDRTKSCSQPRSTSIPGSFRSREHSRDRFMSPFQNRSQRVISSRRRKSGSASIGSRSRSPARSHLKWTMKIQKFPEISLQTHMYS